MTIDFGPSWMDEDLELYRTSVRRFVESEMLPGDEAARKRGHVCHEIWQRAGEPGFLCTDIPDRDGGGDGDFRHETVLYEEMARRSLTGMCPSIHSIVAHYFLNHGTETQKHVYHAAHGARRDRRRAGDDRAGRRLRPAGIANARRTGRRSLRAQRHEDLHHEWPPGGRPARGREDRSGETRGRHVDPDRRDRGLPRFPRRASARQDRAEGAGHLRAVFRRRTRADGSRARRCRRAGLLPDHVGPAVRAADHRRDGGRCDGGRVRRDARLRAQSRSVRAAGG
ncbi:Acyl-CoA dehydrogenase-like protein [Burkholderia lata]|uniref:Acyl-CoA dehydrogenase-like protein n=1 Tax=Burkholderia lata (strain ATCC 17760 / DSM 23089 / LMG 22485 / NCIMB 9086 / R18194 / 383) TaxID=482957 RepID=Q39P24_BURL3|nr:Acyl-CoA dehydrogenase-like protein [Burkholderia lata]